MNPARSPIVTSCLPSFCANVSTSSTTSGSVTTVRTISTNFMTGAGLKKCSPTTLPGRPVATAISVTDSEEVFVARMVSGRHSPSSRPKIERLRSRCSGTASTTRSASARASSVGGVGDPVEQPLPLRLAELAARDRPCRGVLDVGARLPDGTLVDFHRDDVQPVAGEHLDDPGAHRAQPDDADP